MKIDVINNKTHKDELQWAILNIPPWDDFWLSVPPYIVFELDRHLKSHLGENIDLNKPINMSKRKSKKKKINRGKNIDLNKTNTLKGKSKKKKINRRSSVVRHQMLMKTIRENEKHFRSI